MNLYFKLLTHILIRSHIQSLKIYFKQELPVISFHLTQVWEQLTVYLGEKLQHMASSFCHLPVPEAARVWRPRAPHFLERGAIELLVTRVC